MKNSLLNSRVINADLAALLLRLIFGGLFIYHGYIKIVSYDKILPMFKDLIGIGAKLSFNLVIFAEFFCGFLIVVGYVTRLAVIVIFINMSVAFFMAHAKDKFMMKELPFLFWLLCFVVFILGSGKYSLDRLVFRNRDPES